MSSEHCAIASPAPAGLVALAVAYFILGGGICALYISSAIILNATYGRTILPMPGPIFGAAYGAPGLPVPNPATK